MNFSVLPAEIQLAFQSCNQGVLANPVMMAFRKVRAVTELNELHLKVRWFSYYILFGFYILVGFYSDQELR